MFVKPRIMVAAAVTGSLVAGLIGCGSTQDSRSAVPISDVVSPTVPVIAAATVISAAAVASAATMASAADLAVSVAPVAVEPTLAAAPQAMPPVALIGADGRLTVIRGGQASDSMNALVTADGHSAVEFNTVGSDTELTWHDLTTGVSTAPTLIDGTLTATALDPSAQIVALTATPEAGRTEIVIAGADGERFRQTYEVELFPEGFANAWEPSARLPFGLFVIEYLDRFLDPEAPRAYRVRVIELATGALGLPSNLRSKGETVDEKMTGFARTHVTSERDGLLFTLYRGVNPDDSTYAFVHTLGFVDGVWCLDVPGKLELHRVPGSMALAPDGSKLYVGSANGPLAEYVIDDILNPARVPEAGRVASLGSAGDAAPAMTATADRLISPLNHRITWLDRTTLAGTSAVNWADTVDAIAATPIDTVLIGGSDSITELSAAGKILSRVDLPPDLGPIAGLVPLG